jgi:hypothetical protein
MPNEQTSAAAVEAIETLKAKLAHNRICYVVMSGDLDMVVKLAGAYLAKPATPLEGDAELVALCERVFLAGHWDGWRGNQLRRDVHHVDAEKSWQSYVKDGALNKALATLQRKGPL